MAALVARVWVAAIWLLGFVGRAFFLVLDLPLAKYFGLGFELIRADY